MAKKKPDHDLHLAKDRELSPSEADEIEKDIGILKTLGHAVPLVTVDKVGPPAYRLTPPDNVAMATWRMALEQEGFEVVSSLDPDRLGFSAKRRVVKGKGWT